MVIVVLNGGTLSVCLQGRLLNGYSCTQRRNSVCLQGRWLNGYSCIQRRNVCKGPFAEWL